MISDLKPYRQMRDSGVEWLGRVPEHWKEVRAKAILRKMERLVRETDEVVTCFRDGTVTLRKNRRTEGFTESLKEEGYRGIRKGDLVIHAMDAFAGAIGVSDSDGKATSVYSVCTPRRESVVPHYYALCIREMARSQWILALSKGIRERSTDFRYAIFGAEALPAPSLGEQRAIVRFLDHVNLRTQRYIGAKQKLIALLEEQKQAIIHQAVTGQIDVRTRKPYHAYKDSDADWLHEIPSHWEIRRSKRTFRPRRELAWPDDIQLSATQAYGAIAQEDFEIRVGRKVVKISRHLEQRRHVEIDDFVISMRSFQGGLERAWVSGCIRSSYIVLQPIAALSVGYFGHLFKSVGYIKALQATANFIRDGPDLNFDNFCRVDLPFPPIGEQEGIAEALDDVTEHIAFAIDRARRQIEVLTEYRTALIADVVTGKIDVREATAKLPATDDDDVDHEAGMGCAGTSVANDEN